MIIILGFINISTFFIIGKDLSMIFNKVAHFMDFSLMYLGSQGASNPHNICVEKNNNGIEATVVNPGGTGSGIDNGREKMNKRNAKPISCKEFFNSFTVMTFSVSLDCNSLSIRPLRIMEVLGGVFFFFLLNMIYMQQNK